MTPTITGTLIHIGPIQTVGANGFRKREIVIQTPGQYPQTVKCEVTKDRADLLNTFSVGESVRCAYDLKGRPFTRKDGTQDWFTSVEAYLIERVATSVPVTHAPFGNTPGGDPDVADIPF